MAAPRAAFSFTHVLQTSTLLDERGVPRPRLSGTTEGVPDGDGEMPKRPGHLILRIRHGASRKKG